MILVVEDDETMRHVLQVFLEDKGYVVLAARDGLEGLKIYRNRASEIRLVLSDVMMPKLNGIEMWLQLKAIDSNVDVVFGTGFLDGPTRQRLTDLGITKILQKPYLPKEVLEAIREIVGDPPSSFG